LYAKFWYKIETRFEDKSQKYLQLYIKAADGSIEIVKATRIN
jgi:hypothetical protein